MSGGIPKRQARIAQFLRDNGILEPDGPDGVGRTIPESPVDDTKYDVVKQGEKSLFVDVKEAWVFIGPEGSPNSPEGSQEDSLDDWVIVTDSGW